MRLTKIFIYGVVLLSGFTISCCNSAEKEHGVERNHRAELDALIINEIFNQSTFFALTNIEEEYTWMKNNILKNCKYYRNSKSKISIYTCYWGERLMGRPFFKTVCLLDEENDLKLCFNYNDWDCMYSDKTLPCFDSEYMERIKDCDSYRMLENYLNYYIDNLSSIKDAQNDIPNAIILKEISTVVDSVLKLVYFLRINQENSFIIDRTFYNIEREYRRDESGCCFQVMHDNKKCLEELIKVDDVLVYTDACIYWFVWINPNPKEGNFGRKYITIEPFNFECSIPRLYL